MAVDYTIKVSLDDEKIKKLEDAGLGGSIKDKVLEVPMPQKNKRKFMKAFPDTVLNDETGEVSDFPEEAAGLLFDTVIENGAVEVMSLFLMKAFKPLAGKEIRRSIHSA